MQVKFLWGDGRIDYGAPSLHHVNLVQRMGGTHPSDFISGVYDSATGAFTDILRNGSYPSPEEIRFMLEFDMAKYEDKEPFKRFSATVEDTEPEFNLSFLEDPHDELYPCAWENDRMRPEALKAIKGHVLDALRTGGYPDADQWIYFTVFGSGASYNWDEDGDFDVQMWVDIDKYNESHDKPMVADDLVTAVRAVVQPVNFPSFADLNLKVEGCNGKMLIQFYPQPGTGSKDENLAKKPYACYDMETNEWLEQPKPYTADFYGTHFLAIQNKANDIAQQAETLVDELQRNVLSFQFWSGLWSKYKNDHYQEAAEDAQDKAELNKQGVATLFEGVFGGRQQAYSPEGKGIEDERDATQKLLEVWGIFQKLKHYARSPLPWDEQEMPKEPAEKESAWKESSIINDYDDLPSYMAFGFINGHLVLGWGHHQIIIAALIHHGWTWEDLLNAPQAWGWLHNRPDKKQIGVSFSSDSGFQGEQDAALQAIQAKFPEATVTSKGGGYGVTEPEEYGNGISGSKNLQGYLNNPEFSSELAPGGGIIRSHLPDPPVKTGSLWKEAVNIAGDSFGFVNGHLVLGYGHHQSIMGALLSHGWTWEDLLNVPQAWGWFSRERDYSLPNHPVKKISVSFSSDAGVQNQHVFDQCLAAFEKLFGVPATKDPYEKSIEDTGKEYGEGLAGKDNLNHYINEGDATESYIVKETPIPPPPAQDKQQDSQGEQMSLFDHPNPGGGVPPPKKNAPPSESVEFHPGDLAMSNLPGMTGEVVIIDPKDFEGDYWIEDENGDNDYINEKYLTKIEKPGGPGGGMAPPKKTDTNVKVGDKFDTQTGYTWTITKMWSNMLSAEWVDNNSDKTGQQDFTIDTWKNMMPHLTKLTSIQKFAQWQDLMEKAQRLRQNGQVGITVNDPDHVVGTVQGDHGTYQTEIWRDDPASQAITMWDCECPWSQYSWGRTRQWKKYEGRPCAHTLALFWEAQSQPPQQDQSAAPEQAPPVPTPGGGMIPQQGLISPVQLPNVTLPVTGVPGQGIVPPGGPVNPEPVPAAIGPTPYSVPVTPQQAQPGVISFPGALSHVRTASPYGMAWQNLYNQLKGLHTIAQYGPGYLSTIYHRLTNGENPENVIADLPPEVQEELLRTQHEGAIKTAAFQNGEHVRCKYDVTGEDTVTNKEYLIPQQSSGTVLYSDEVETVVIFPLAGSYHSPHLVKVEGLTYEFYADPAVNPFIKRHR